MKRSSPIDYNTIFSPATVLKSFGSAVDGTLPLDGSGLRAMVVRVTATAAGFVRMSSSQAPVTATKNDTLIQPGDFLLMRTAGMDYVSFISDSASATCTISPQEWGGYVTGTVVQFSPAMLFTGTTTGAWYDPSDLNTLFQDAAGTQPVTAVEQPVGLMLDKSKGLVLGPELVVNGDFSSSTGWVQVAATITGGQAVFTASSNFSALYRGANPTLPSGTRSYRVVYTITSATAGRIKFRFGAGVEGTWRNTAGTYSEIFTTITGGGNDNLIFYTDAFTGSIDNISVRELPGNHAFNSSGNSANFPVLSARYNLLTKTEDFSDAVWQKNGATVSANSIIAPDGTLTADKLVEDSGTSEHFLTSASYTVPATSATVLIYAKAAGRTSFIVDFRSVDAGQGRAVFDLSAVTATVQLGSGASATITAVGDGWFRCVLAATLAANTSSAKIALVSGGTSNYTGDGTSGIYIWGADLRVANDGVNQPAYQRVNTATDYDTVGFKPYLRFNGTNQWLQTNSIDFSYGDKMFVSAGVRKLSDAAASIIAELSSTAASNAGSFYITGPESTGASGDFRFKSRGSLDHGPTTPGSILAPISSVLSGVGDIANDVEILRINGVQKTTNSSDQGTGNYGNYPLYIGARAGSSLWFNGHLYGMVIAGKQASAAEITSTETYINQKTGAY